MWSLRSFCSISPADAARAALEAAGIRVLAIRDVVTVRLRQDEPGQLGKISRRMLVRIHEAVTRV